MIENEFKIMLTREQYERLLGMYDFKTAEQINYYYDTDDLAMSARRITVRVRELSGKLFLQMKLPAGADFSRRELSREIPELPQSIAAETLSSICGEECPDVSHVSLLGSLKTTRSVWEFEGGEVDLDKSEYFGKTDYELEIEFTDESAARSVLGEIKTALGITAGDVCAGKVRRFLEEYNKTRRS